MSDPLTNEVTRTLWPYLQSEGFLKVTPRKFVRESNGIFQQLWIDANGFGGKKRTYVILCASLPFGPIQGYMDPHGFRIGNDRTWNMATPEAALKSMQQVVAALREHYLLKIEAISGIEILLDLLKDIPGRDWHTTYSQAYEKWLAKDPELLAVEEGNRRALKL